MKVEQKSEIFSNYVENATIHGIGKINKSRNICTRLFWILILIFFFSYLVYQVYGLCKKLSTLDYNTVVSTKVHDGEGLTFPAITLCNANGYPNKRVTAALRSFYPNLTAQTHEYYELFQSVSLEFNMDKAAKLGYQKEEFIMSETCFFGKTNCFSSNFTKLTIPDYGNCYTFNNDGSIMQQRTGINSGFTILMDIKQDSYMQAIRLDDMIPVGAYVTIHKPGEIVNLKDQAIIATPNQLTRIGIKKIEYVNLAYPYPDNCTQPRNMSVLNLPYTVYLCLQICYVEEMYNNCESVDVYTSISSPRFLGKQLKTAITPNETKCIDQYVIDYHKGNIKCDCPILCNEIEYEKTVSNGIWPSKSDMIRVKELYPNITDEYIKENLVALQVYFEDFTVVRTIHQPAYDLNMFFSDLGGQVGLWIGASIFSFIEIGALMIDLLTSCLYTKNEKIKKTET